MNSETLIKTLYSMIVVAIAVSFIVAMSIAKTIEYAYEALIRRKA